MRRFIALAALLLAPVVLSGCGSDSGIEEPGPSVVGVYALTSFDGAPLPVTLIAGDPKLEVVSDEITLAAGGAFTQATSLRWTEGGVASTQSHVEIGTYTASGSTLSFRFSSDNSTGSATVSGRNFTIVSVNAFASSSQVLSPVTSCSVSRPCTR